jgi:hypothetical protein
MCLSILIITICSLKAYAQGPAWEQQLRQQIPVASIGNNGLVVRPGVPVTIIKDGITALPVSPPLAPGMAWPNTYKKGGRVGTSALQRINYGPTQQYSRVLQVGERVNIYSIQLKGSEIVLSLQTAPGGPAERPYRATVAFQFQKGEMETSDLNSVEAYIGEVLQIDTAVGVQSEPSAPISGQHISPPTSQTIQLRLPVRFVNAQQASDRFDLKLDGTFSLQEGGQNYHGTFVQNGNSLELNILDTDTKTTVTFDGTKLVDASGQTWVMQPVVQ